MTKKIQKDNTDCSCPLGDLTAALEEASNFYRRREENDLTYRETTGWDDPQVLACRKVIDIACSDDLVNEVCINGVCWRRASVPDHRWVDANASPPRHGGQRSHYHTTFDLDGHSVHVDYIKRSSSGPGSGVHDTLFFVDGQFVSRGGHAFTVPARIPRGEPAAMQWRNHLLVCKHNIDHWSTPHPSWFTLWKRVSQVERKPQPPNAERIQLQCGIEISIESLIQTRTYSGMLEGFPNERLNRSLIKKTLEDLRNKQGETVHLIEPSMTPCPEQDHVGAEPWLELPAIKCIAQFGSRSVGEFGSRLTVLWYQTHFATPIEQSVLHQLQDLNWPKLAEAINDI